MLDSHVRLNSICTDIRIGNTRGYDFRNEFVGRDLWRLLKMESQKGSMRNKGSRRWNSNDELNSSVINPEGGLGSDSEVLPTLSEP
jgi:hypothetical protein